MRRIVIAACCCAAWLAAQQAPPAFPDGVASGDVTAYSAILWTRSAAGAMLAVEVSPDPQFRRAVTRRAVETNAAGGFTAKVEARPLAPSTTYYYRWLDGPSLSETGTFRTAPQPGTTANLRFVFAGDSDGTRVEGKPSYNNFEVLDAARREDPDFFVYLGDTVYTDSEKRPHGPATTLDEYRDTYRENRSYPALRELMRSTSTYAVWDDHEFRNDFSPAGLPDGLYDIGRQAFLEWMPVRDSFLPAGGCAGRPMFRVIRWGTEALIVILDERSCRSPSAASACLDDTGAPDLAPALPPELRTLAGLRATAPAGCLAAIADPGRTMLGRTQRELLMLVLRYFPARFKFVISEVPATQLFALPYDRWEGYAAERDSLLGFIEKQRIPNVVFLAADLHATVSSRVSQTAGTSLLPAVATEMVTGPIAIDPLLKTLSAYPAFNPNAYNALLPQLGVACVDLEHVAYGLVEVDASAGRARLTVKDQYGMPLCERTLE